MKLEIYEQAHDPNAGYYSYELTTDKQPEALYPVIQWLRANFGTETGPIVSDSTTAWRWCFILEHVTRRHLTFQPDGSAKARNNDQGFHYKSKLFLLMNTSEALQFNLIFDEYFGEI